ncbi:hypothetical protein KIL84_019962 [Mauremys mutica]|uniref:Uncharacterized protein n=1 Tax=Mauremys mutica TaxID=74926 RepID=A0A9D4BAH6_9SAUR|nr:hypothetical protein KIL84_019962 [Mauremys mutica]
MHIGHKRGRQMCFIYLFTDSQITGVKNKLLLGKAKLTLCHSNPEWLVNFGHIFSNECFELAAQFLLVNYLIVHNICVPFLFEGISSYNNQGCTIVQHAQEHTDIDSVD